MVEVAASEAEGLLENSLRIDSQFPYLAKNLSDQMAAALEISEPLIYMLGVSTDGLRANVFRDAMIEAVEFLNHPLTGPLIADTVQQVCDFFVAEYFALSEKTGAEFSAEALKWIDAQKNARYKAAQPFFEEKLAKANGTAAENI